MQEAAHICSRNFIGHGQGGTLEIIGRELRVRNHISEKPKSPNHFYNLLSIPVLTCAPFSRREISVCCCQHSLSRKMGIFPVVRKYSLWLMISLFTIKNVSVGQFKKHTWDFQSPQRFEVLNFAATRYMCCSVTEIKREMCRCPLLLVKSCFFSGVCWSAM